MPAAPITRFMEALSRCPVLDAVQREQLPELQQRFEDPRALAGELLRRGWLTAYQVNLIAKGRSAEFVGPYVILTRLGEGGMGQVFKARQASLQRIVALKVIRPECLANPRVVRRFLREIRAASQLTHPHIVHAYDADQIDGAYYIAMEFVDGIDLARLVRQSGPLPIWQACDLVRQAALGLQHAFERGLVHRDIKPANLLVTGLTGREPEAQAKATPVVKITDFGLARWTDDEDPGRPTSHLTQMGTLLGTPEFLSPEQARSSSTCDIRADLYSLGCTFYYLLASQVPFPTGTLTDKLLQHQLDHPDPVGKVRGMRLAARLSAQEFQQLTPDQLCVPAPVEEVVSKLLAKHPGERHQTPAELAEVLAAIQDRLARGVLPIPPRPQPETLVEFDVTPRAAPARPVRNAVRVVQAPTPPQPRRMLAPRRFWPWILLSALMAVPLLAVAAGLAVVAVWSSRASDPEPAPNESHIGADAPHWQKLQLKAQTKSPPGALQDELLAFRMLFPASVHVREADEWLSRLPSPFDTLDRTKLPKMPGVTPPDMVAVFGQRRGYIDHPASIVAVSPDGRWLLGAEDPALRLWDTADLARPPARLQPHAKRLHAAAFTPDGKRLVTAGSDLALRVWDPATRQRVGTLEKHEAPVTRLAFRRDGTLLASAGADGRICLWDMVSGTASTSFSSGLDEVYALAFSPDGETLFWGEGPRVRWTRVGGTAKPGVFETPDSARVLAFAPDGHTLLCGGGQGSLLVCTWDGRQLVRRATLEHRVVSDQKKHALPIHQAVFSPDGRLIATASSDTRVRIWDARTLALSKEWDVRCPAVAAAFAPDGRHLISGNGNSTLTVFRLASYTADTAK